MQNDYSSYTNSTKINVISVCVCVCKPLDTRGIWERKRADIAALSVFLTTCSKNHNLQPTFVQFLLFQQGGLAYNQGPIPTKLPDCMGYRV